jgi:hypothetical protein
LVGGDYPHSYPLPDGRVLWLFQDGFLGVPDTPRLDAAGFAHTHLDQRAVRFAFQGIARF